MGFLPLTTFVDVTSKWLEVVTDNIVPILGLMGFSAAVAFVTKRLTRHGKAK